jgi:MFS transporter, putative metabolite:H+ symporter
MKMNGMSDLHIRPRGRAPSSGRLGTVSPRGMRIAFLVGSAFVSVGVVLHAVDIVRARKMGYTMAGTPMSAEMLVGMCLIGVGLVVALLALFRQPRARRVDIHLVRRDEERLTPAHWKLLAVLVFGLVIDTMKPLTIGFVLPGMRSEYGLSVGTVAYLPILALAGTVIGSILFGHLADRVGRYPTIQVATLMFIATSICGAMPGFNINVVMCFLMGVSAGGMLPIVFALISEVAPQRLRTLLTVGVGALGGIGGYVAASNAAALIVPHTSWRFLWLLGFPTGLVLLVFARAIPESPRYLLQQGRADEAKATLARFGVSDMVEVAGAPPHGGVRDLFSGEFARRTISLCVYSALWGFTTFGLIIWLPTELRAAHVASADGVLAQASLLAVPGALACVFFYNAWSTKGSLVFFGLLTAATLGGFSVWATVKGQGGSYLSALAVLLILATTAINAGLMPYAAEVYPTRVRSTAVGVVAGAGKLGGVAGPIATAVALPSADGFGKIAAGVAVGMLAISAVVAWVAVETRGKPLEVTTGETDGLVALEAVALAE